MIKKLLLLVMLFIGFSMTANAGVLSTPGVSFASAGDVTSIASTVAQMPDTAIRQTALDNLPYNDGRASDPTDNKSASSVNVTCNQHQALSTHIVKPDPAIEAAISDKQRTLMTAHLEAPPSNL